MKIGVVSESSEFDAYVYGSLIDKISRLYAGLGPYVKIFPYPYPIHGRADLLSRLSLVIHNFVTRFSLDRIVVIIDGDKDTRESQIKQIKEVTEKIKEFPPHWIIPAVAVRNIEAWLLSDNVALIKVTQANVTKFKKSDSIKDPKKDFDEIFGQYCSKSNIRRTADERKNFALKIIKEANLKTMWKNSTSLRYLCDSLRASYKETKLQRRSFLYNKFGKKFSLFRYKNRRRYKRQRRIKKRSFRNLQGFLPNPG